MMMDCMSMQDGGWMMAGTGLFWVVLIVLVTLAITALVKYIFFSGPQRARSDKTQSDA